MAALCKRGPGRISGELGLLKAQTGILRGSDNGRRAGFAAGEQVDESP